MERLPDKIIPIGNPDKYFHESWRRGRNLMNIPHPFRAVVLGPPNTGKTTIVYNIVERARPPFKRVVVIHCDPEYTEEYNIIENCEMLDKIPAPNEWAGDCKTLCILDDLEFKNMNKDQKRNLDRLFGFVSTHKNVSCILCAQDCFNVPPSVRRCSSLWVLWKIDDLDSLYQVARKCGLTKAKFLYFMKYLKHTNDSLWIDNTKGTPAKIRLNCYTPLSEPNSKHIKKK